MVNEKVKELYDQLEAGVQEVLTSDQWGAFLRFQASFHHYSFHNALLIYLQCPHATLVKGYQGWKQLGRYVKPGEKAIRILAPRRVTVEVKGEDETQGKEPTKKQILVGFRTVCVFDVSQTEGAELPAPPIRLLEGSGEAAQRLYDALMQVIPIPVTEEDTGRANGYYDRVANRIALKRGLPLNHATKTLIHEYVHSLVHGLDAERVTREHAEAVAEGAAFVVANYFGLDTSDYSFGYVASWAGDLELVRQVGGEIQSVAARVIDQVEAVLQPQLAA